MEIESSLVGGERVNKQESSPHRLSSSGTGKGPRSPPTELQGLGKGNYTATVLHFPRRPPFGTPGELV